LLIQQEILGVSLFLRGTLPRNDLLCHLNWGAQVLMEISSNV
jgi:hypothetical protein